MKKTNKQTKVVYEAKNLRFVVDILLLHTNIHDLKRKTTNTSQEQPIFECRYVSVTKKQKEKRKLVKDWR